MFINQFESSISTSTFFYPRNFHDATTQIIQDTEKRVVILGAGMAGLSTAHRLIKSGFKNVKILEASDRYCGHKKLHKV
jgi:ribulose 1,5-bisphosphate synthetase/thiazole synthase